MLVLITGSRRCSPAMAIKVKEVVNWLLCQGHGLIVGDAAGVDQVAIYEMLRLGKSGCVEICSAHSRLLTFPGAHVSTVLKKGNLFRNRYMVDKCDMVFAIWDGRSSGTRYTFNYALAQGKNVIVFNFFHPALGRP